jgi:hypothetical protein
MPADLVRPAPPPELKSLLNDVIGPCARSWVYSYFLAADANGDRATGRPITLMCSDAAISGTQRWLWSKAGNKIASTMHGGMVMSDEHIEKCVADLDRGLVRLGELLADESALGPEMIADGVPNRNHLAIAAICYPLVFPPQSMVPFFGREVVTTADVPPPMAAQVERYRATPAGQMTLRLYAACRLAVVKHTSGDSQ